MNRTTQAQRTKRIRLDQSKIGVAQPRLRNSSIDYKKIEAQAKDFTPKRARVGDFYEKIPSGLNSKSKKDVYTKLVPASKSTSSKEPSVFSDIANGTLRYLGLV